MILATRTDVESGASLADAMRKHPKTFDPLFTNMIAAGEAGGILDTILKRLATYIEKAVKLAGQVKSAMIYPIAVICIATVVVAAILWKVIPTFAQLFAGLGAQLPLPTRVVIAASSAFRRAARSRFSSACSSGVALRSAGGVPIRLPRRHDGTAMATTITAVRAIGRARATDARLGHSAPPLDASQEPRSSSTASGWALPPDRR